MSNDLPEKLGKLAGLVEQLNSRIGEIKADLGREIGDLRGEARTALADIRRIVAKMSDRISSLESSQEVDDRVYDALARRISVIESARAEEAKSRGGRVWDVVKMVLTAAVGAGAALLSQGFLR